MSFNMISKQVLPTRVNHLEDLCDARVDLVVSLGHFAELLTDRAHLLLSFLVIVKLVVHAQVLRNEEVGGGGAEHILGDTRNEEQVLRDHLGALLVTILDRALIDLVEALTQDGNQKVQHDDHCYGRAENHKNVEGGLLDVVTLVLDLASTQTNEETEDEREAVAAQECAARGHGSFNTVRHILLDELLVFHIADSQERLSEADVHDDQDKEEVSNVVAHLDKHSYHVALSGVSSSMTYLCSRRF